MEAKQLGGTVLCPCAGVGWGGVGHPHVGCDGAGAIPGPGIPLPPSGAGDESHVHLATARPSLQPALAPANLRSARDSNGPRHRAAAARLKPDTLALGDKATRPGTLGPSLRLSKKRERNKFLKPSTSEKRFVVWSPPSARPCGTARSALAIPSLATQRFALTGAGLRPRSARVHPGETRGQPG